MTITRINQFKAQPGSEEKLYDFLTSVITAVTKCPGSISCELFRGAEDSANLLIIEEWESIEAHQAAAKAIPPEMIAQAMMMFAQPPTGAYYTDQPIRLHAEP